MLLRRAFYWWLFPAAFLLPLWLLIGWGTFQAGGWAFVWIIFIAIPSVFLGQLALAVLVRARGTVRAQRAVSWADVAGFTLWHGLTIACGFFNPSWFWAAFLGATVVGAGMFWMTFRQLWSEATPGSVILRTSGPEHAAYIPAPERSAGPRPPGDHDVIVVTERPPTA